MRKLLLGIAVFAFFGANMEAQHIKFEEYKLDNGLHVILHKDNTTPVVTTGVMYHVGAKDEVKGRTGFAHFFEHLLFEGTKNIKRGDWFKIVSANGGSNNANTTSDRTYYYETFPSNNVQLGLWMESERMRHAVINQIGVDTQRDVVKEEKRSRMDNKPYGNFFTALQTNLFEKHPYSGTVIGTMEDLSAAKLPEFLDFYKKYYVPNNATLVVAGDIDVPKVKQWINEYYGDIPKGKLYAKDYPMDSPITQEKEVNYYDKNIQIPAYLYAYRTPAERDRDSYALEMLGKYLSNGKSSVLYKKIVDKEKKALQIGAFNIPFEQAGIFAVLAIPMGDTPMTYFKNEIDTEIKKIQTQPISNEDFQKLQNQMENQYVNSNSTVEGIASSLATAHVLLGDTDMINKEIEIYRSITKEDLMNVAKKYLNPNQRVIINYIPEKK